MVSVSQQIKPPVQTASSTQNFSDAKVDHQTAMTSVDDNKKTDFRTLITNSMDDVKKRRVAKENGDLSSSSDAEFLEKLADQTKEKRVPKNELGKDDFLKLFVTQLQNQDPMNPDDGTEMAAKLAQFNGLEQMMNVNKGIEKLITAQQTDRNMNMMSYIGKEVTVDGGRVRLVNGNPTNSEFVTEAPVASASLEIRDANGMIVNQLDLGSMDKGTHKINWDGKNSEGKQLTEGVFTYSISARNSDGDSIPIKLESKARINGVDIKDKDGALFSDFGKVTFDQIRSVGVIGYDKVATPDAAVSKKPMLEVGQRLGAAIEAAPEKPLASTTADSLDKLAAQGMQVIKKPEDKEKKAEARAGATAETSAPAATPADSPAPEAKVPNENVSTTASAPLQASASPTT